jgi:Ribbon-helix-helix protein, copG family
MRKSIKVTPKKRGRPATGRNPFLTARVPQELIDALEAWAVANEISRSEAIRRLLELGMGVPKRKSSK